ncbi:MAG: tRNA (N(6)-L-threonylcarbamoyladenosine(37)-C(2))-methylthiotransferase MtaB [Oscillospiraceae bacterium]|nr:tRNA (N(6)-L-threonylcarbamoyladenosine(37)-C(2))-methylthiotransferase MtaB [Oscillospiraceae bacterium]
MLCYFYTFGCKVNTCETAGMEKLLREEGFETTNDPSKADIAVINSCTVTASGDSRVLGMVKRLKTNNPSMIIILTGCYAQAFPEKAAKIKEADIVIGTKDRKNLPGLLKEYINRREKLCCVSQYEKEDAFELLKCDSFSKNTRAFLKIQDGCNCFCTYCIIPYARGRCRSMALSDLRESVRSLVKEGHSEIVLCGINLAFYGMEWGGSLLEAVKCVSEEGAVRIRLGSLEPERITDELLEGLAKIPGFCPQFHLSLQSGSDTVLKRMNRRYTAAEYEDICRRVRKYFPDCAFTTDIMTGFPGETEKEFEETMAFAKKTGFAVIHVFRYSRRPGTAAAKMEGQVQESVKTERMKKLRELGEHMQEEHLRKQVGRTVPVLFEREKGDGFHIGHAPDGTVVKIPEKNTKKSLRNSLFYVTIEESDAVCCFGSIADSSSANQT